VEKVAAAGASVGYDSEVAFSRAFKRETGLSPPRDATSPAHRPG
jgi:AraC-like DNA-binding protein